MLLAFLWMVRSFLTTIFTAAILAAMTYPFYSWLLKKTGHKNALSSLITTLLTMALIVVPAFLTALMFMQQTQDLISVATPWVQEQLEAAQIFLSANSADETSQRVQGVMSWLSERISNSANAIGRMTIKAVGGLTSGIATSFFEYVGTTFFDFLLFSQWRKTFKKIR